MSEERCESVYPGTRPYEGGAVPGCDKPRDHDGVHATLLGIHPATEDYPEQEEWTEWGNPS